jgi:starch synthase
MSKNILMLLDNPFTNDSRVKREALALVENGFNVVLLCTKRNNLPEKNEEDGIQIIRLFTESIFDPKKIFEHKKLAKKIIELYNFDIIHAHDQTMLNIAVEIKKIKTNVNLVYDSHELFHSWPLNSSNFDSKLIMLKSILARKYFIRRELRNSKYIDFLITVNNSLAANLKKYFNFNKTITVVRNCPDYSGTFQKTTVLRELFNIDQSKKILVFIGSNIYLNSLNMEQVFLEFKNNTDYVIVVIAGFNEHSNQVKKFISDNGINNVYFHDRVDPYKINYFLSSADVGIVPTWNRKDLSYWLALDNKLFEYIQAGVPVLATQQPEYVAIVEKEKCGVCVNPDEANAYINGFKTILSDYSSYQLNAEQAAKKISWGNEKKYLLELYKTIA